MGAGLYRLGFMDGSMPTGVYRLTAVVGLGVGLPLAVLGVVVTALADYAREVAFVGQIPNTLGTIPAALGYMSLIILWNGGADGALKRRLRAVGRMALTNYLSQTVMGVLVLAVLLDGVEVNRTGVLAFCLGGLDAAAVVVAGVVGPFPVRPGRMAMARRDLPQAPTAAPLSGVLGDRAHQRINTMHAFHHTPFPVRFLAGLVPFQSDLVG